MIPVFYIEFSARLS